MTLVLSCAGMRVRVSYVFASLLPVGTHLIEHVVVVLLLTAVSCLVENECTTYTYRITVY